MKTVRIKVEIEADVPEGKYCRSKEGVLCHFFKDIIPYSHDNPTCLLIHDEVLNEKGMYVNVIKHKKCLDACKASVK